MNFFGINAVFSQKFSFKVAHYLRGCGQTGLRFAQGNGVIRIV